MMIEGGHKIVSDGIGRFAFRPTVSNAVDAGTVELRHFLMSWC
jgi:hypothetical protein